MLLTPMTDIENRQYDSDVALANPAAAVITSFSTLFGLLLAGYFKNLDESAAACNNLNSFGHGKWRQIGLVSSAIQSKFIYDAHLHSMNANVKAEPICASSHAPPNPAQIRPKLIVANTNILIPQLLNSVAGTDKLTYICNNIGLNLISSFPLNGDTVKEAVCLKAGQGLLPRPFATFEGAPAGAVAAAKNTASIIFANLLAAGATTDSQLNLDCTHMPDHLANLNTEGLNADLVQTTVCNQHTPVSPQVAQVDLVTYSTRYFITVLETIGSSPGWLQWLCANLDPVKMSSVGLDGNQVQKQVCAHTKAVK